MSVFHEKWNHSKSNVPLEKLLKTVFLTVFDLIDTLCNPRLTVPKRSISCYFIKITVKHSKVAHASA